MLGGVYLVAGIIAIAMGVKNNMFAFPHLYTMACTGLMLVGVIGVAVPQHMGVAHYIARIVVGSVFIVSGLIKANDALGFSYKLEEYFAENALGLTALEPISLFMSCLVAIGEVVLGLAVLFGGRAKLAAWALLALTLFFAWLTWYTATCDPADTYTTIIDGEEMVANVNCVTDCG